MRACVRVCVCVLGPVNLNQAEDVPPSTPISVAPLPGASSWALLPMPTYGAAPPLQRRLPTQPAAKQRAAPKAVAAMAIRAVLSDPLRLVEAAGVVVALEMPEGTVSVAVVGGLPVVASAGVVA